MTVHRTSTAINLALMCLACACARSSDTLSGVTKSLEAARKSWGAAKANLDVVTTRGASFPGPDPLPPVEKSRITWIAKGNQLRCIYDRKDIGERAGKQIVESVKVVNVYDGQRDSELSTTASSSPYVHIGKDRPTTFNPLETGYTFAGMWFADIVKSSTFRLDGAAEDPKFGHLAILAGKDPRGEMTLKLFVSAKYPGLVVRCEATNDRPALIVNRLTEATHAGGTWIPVSGSQIESVRQKDGRWGRWWTREYTVSNLSVQAVPDSVFVLPKLKPGTNIMNQIDGHIYEVGPAGEWMEAGSIGHHSASQPKPVRWSGWLFMASVVTLIVISALRIVNWRRRLAGS